jgi:hypothetical protein
VQESKVGSVGGGTRKQPGLVVEKEKERGERPALCLLEE